MTGTQTIQRYRYTFLFSFYDRQVEVDIEVEERTPEEECRAWDEASYRLCHDHPDLRGEEDWDQTLLRCEPVPVEELEERRRRVVFAEAVMSGEQLVLPEIVTHD